MRTKATITLSVRNLDEIEELMIFVVDLYSKYDQMICDYDVQVIPSTGWKDLVNHSVAGPYGVRV